MPESSKQTVQPQKTSKPESLVEIMPGVEGKSQRPGIRTAVRRKTIRERASRGDPGPFLRPAIRRGQADRPQNQTDFLGETTRSRLLPVTPSRPNRSPLHGLPRLGPRVGHARPDKQVPPDRRPAAAHHALARPLCPARRRLGHDNFAQEVTLTADVSQFRGARLLAPLDLARRPRRPANTGPPKGAMCLLRAAPSL